MKVTVADLCSGRLVWLVLALCALVVTLPACSNDTGATGEQTVDYDALDVDFDTLDVDVTGVDIATFQDVQKQDTIGVDVPPDVQLDTAPDVQLDVAPDVAPPECVTDTDCADDLTCTTDTCTGGKCSHSDSTGPCDDGSACTVGDTCGNGACLPGTVTPCTDDNPCTADSCAPTTGCVNAPIDATCTDGNVCTLNDACIAGKCQATQFQSCDDGLPCTDDVCDPVASCVHLANAATCDDGDNCTVDDHCADATCVATPKNCDDNNVCTADGCNADGCTHTLPDAWIDCDDNNICTDNDHCNGATCSGSPVVCFADNPIPACSIALCDLAVGCTLTASTLTCDDGDPCTLSDTCKNFVCLGGDVSPCVDGDPCTVDACTKGVGCDNSVATSCDDGNSCTADSCSVDTGCVHTALPGESICDDGDACTDGTVCSFGPNGPTCGMGTPVNCDDASVCTIDSCDPKLGCVYLPSGLTCTDNNVCTVGDFCAGHFCVGYAANPCDDGNPCTTDTCISGGTIEGGGCQHAALVGPCDDGDPCTAGDVCVGTVCTPGTAPGCDDKNACTLDFCNAVGVGCSHTPSESTVCDDGNVCTTVDTCSKGTGVCVGTQPTVCTPDTPCQSDKCDPVAGCTYAPICDDGDPCTLDSCALGKCSYQALSVFHETFAKGNVNGWTLGTEWQIGNATQGPEGQVPPGDPAYGHSSSDSGIAGVDIGGNAQIVVHDYYWLTSPVVDTSKLTAPRLEFWRWLDSGTQPYTTNAVEAWDGQAWQSLWTNSTADGPSDTVWTREVYDLTAVSNAKLQVRFGFKIDDGFAYSGGSWNLDDVTIGESGACIHPLPVTGPVP